ncbi:hypothetical protein QM012_001316 [Aureobasidium pullulans]|uniref:V-SNARE coiled-coil homology domain-containing protein n=1 Tax=Aureobasidium pullulans TaxID=5580 RepID=A0ABR0TDQ2_AURPU
MATEDKTKEELETKIHALQNVMNTLRREKAETERKNEELRLVHLRRESITSQLRRENDRLQAANDNLTISNHNLRHNIAAMSTNVDQWAIYASEGRAQLSKLNLYADEVEKLLDSKKTRVAEVEARLEDLEERNEDLEERLVTKKIKAQAFQAEYDELQRRHEALWETVNFLDQIVEEDQSEVMRLRRGILYLKKLWESYEQQ